MRELWKENDSGVVLGTKNDHEEVKFLAYPDDLALFGGTGGGSDECPLKDSHENYTSPLKRQN